MGNWNGDDTSAGLLPRPPQPSDVDIIEYLLNRNFDVTVKEGVIIAWPDRWEKAP